RRGGQRGHRRFLHRAVLRAGDRRVVGPADGHHPVDAPVAAPAGHRRPWGVTWESRVGPGRAALDGLVRRSGRTRPGRGGRRRASAGRSAPTGASTTVPEFRGAGSVRHGAVLLLLALTIVSAHRGLRGRAQWRGNGCVAHRSWPTWRGAPASPTRPSRGCSTAT